ncbi:LytR/AlgR family response regulator transcription factor [Chryseolinea soli]|uniref:DNA-binding response regulator n=1 Tax=Chryseolinea soli TaxID=2321403 RepID=A0A385SQP2_9BACT|nr:LytTR family DNA-binding domain-containing protein [Chryseolinea soli]AYB34113.1 DNA-binding response regulator [Chryseolinea soli]
MKVVIIEDERLTADDLAETIQQFDTGIEISAKLLSVKDAVRYFQKHEEPDLIFSDIQLGDGLSFEIFKATKISVPVIFCTAYDEYALTAFGANGIDYLLKPFTSASVAAALEKFYRITKSTKGPEALPLEKIMKLFETRAMENTSAILVHYKEKILPIKLQDTAVFYLEGDVVHLVTFDRKVYFPGKTLEELEKVAGRNFYRANRQILVNREAILDVSNHLGRKLWVNVSVPLKESVTVSKEKTPHFLKWLSGDNTRS